MASAILLQISDSAARDGRSASTIRKQLTPLWRGARPGQQQAFHKGPLLMALHPFHPATTLFYLTRGVLRDYTGDIELDHFFAVSADSAVLAHGRSTLAPPRRLLL